MNGFQLGTYRHSKTGNLYRAIAVGKDSETLVDMVIYEALYENPVGKIWIRPLTMFLETVVVKGKKVPRFEVLKK